MRRLFILSLLALSSCSHSSRFPSSTVGGPDGIEFNVVQLDTRVNCDSVILKGTKRYAGSVFILPRILVSVNKEGDTLFEVIPDGNGGYEFDFALYVPRTEHDLDYRKNTALYLHGCNIDEVMESLNRGVAKKDQVDRPVRVPVKSIDIQVEGMDGAYQIGSGDTTLLNYQGLDHKVSFKIQDKKALELFLRRLTGNIGISIKAKVRFSARTSDGYVSADVDMTSVSTSVAAKLKGKATVASADLSAAIRSSLSSTNVKIYSEAGTSDTYKKISDEIIAMVMKSVSELKVTPPAGGDAPATPDPSGGGPINVSAAVSYLRDAKTQHIEYTGLGENHEEVYETSAILKAEAGDPENNEVTLKTTSGSYSYPAAISAGDQIAFAPVEEHVEDIGYHEVLQYMTSSQLKELNYSQYFPGILDTRYSITDMNMPGVGVLAKTRPAHWWNAMDTMYYVWGSSDLAFDVRGAKAVDHEWTAAALPAWAFRVRFSKVGGRAFTLGDLVADNAYWKGEFDATAGKVVITAKKDLGTAQVMIADTPSMFNYVSHYSFQERRNSSSQNLGRDRANEIHANLPQSRRVLKLRIGSTDAKSAPPSLVPAASDESAGLVVPKKP